MEEYVFYPGAEERLDVYLSAQLGYTRSRVRTLVERGDISYNGETVKKCGQKLNGGILCADIEDPVAVTAEPENIPIDIVYQDADIAVIDKPQGMVTHPCAGTPSGTLVNALVYCVKDLSAINGVLRPGIVHRLDKDTSGLLVIAKNNAAHLSLAEQIRTKTAGRYYIALLCGNIKDDKGVIDEPIARSRKDRKKMAIDPNGRRAVTYYTVKERFGEYTLVEFKLGTGRTHQIRVHAKFINHPVVGDTVYGKKDCFGLNGQLLHAYKLELTHPSTGERMIFSAPIPDYFQAVLDKLRKGSN
jgi:23S rRNA pseudouridine1911/1915/1917 synthase